MINFKQYTNATTITIPNNVKITNNDLSNAFQGMTNLTKITIPNSVTNVSNAFRGCIHLINPATRPIMNITNMAYAYTNCTMLTSISCGNSVTNMAYAYQNCRGIKKGSLQADAIVGSNVTEINYAFANTHGIEIARCPAKVVNMPGAYSNCRQLTTSACGSNVVNMANAYNSCCNLTKGRCGKNVRYMQYAYNNCRNLKTAICGNSVNNAYRAFMNCRNLRNCYIYSQNISNLMGCFANKNNSVRLNIYTLKTGMTNSRLFYYNTQSIVGANISWSMSTDNGISLFYNTQYNIYAYRFNNIAELQNKQNANGDTF